MYECQHSSEAPRKRIESLHRNQRGAARWKCPACAFGEGYGQALQFGSEADFREVYADHHSEECQVGNSVPVQVLDTVPVAQAKPGRHRCAICAFLAGLRSGVRALSKGTASPTKIISLSVRLDDYKDKKELRKLLVGRFLQERPGKGPKDRATRYHYKVEDLRSGNKIVLRRPARLHAGFDFLVCVEGHNFAARNKRRRDFPKHAEMIADLIEKRESNGKEYRRLYELINRVYRCQVSRVKEVEPPSFASGLPADAVLGVLKWLFAEQDVRYWNYAGRAKLFKALPPPQ